ncbi:MAG: GcrA family cell cycle regulator [Alphaproteobacteria bacterium]|nr:GcrA family cell cycle regulator [Alphaproteobacteria bacterium]
MSWTEQQIQALKKMWGNGFSASDIAKQLGGGLTRNAVIGKAHRLKLSSRPLSVKQEDGAAVAVATANAMMNITRVSNNKKRVMLRPLPPVQTPRTTPQAMVKEALRPIDSVKRAEGIAVTKAGERHCRWPIGDPRSPEFRFCGCASHEGLPYCVEHARIAYQTVSRRSRAGDSDTPAQEFRLPSASGKY